MYVKQEACVLPVAETWAKMRAEKLAHRAQQWWPQDTGAVQ